MPLSSGIVCGVGFFIHDSYKYRKVDTPNYSSFENMVISVSVSCLAPSLYLPPSWAMFFHFLDEFMSFVCFLSSVDCHYFVCGDFNIHVDVPCTDSHKLKALLESCQLTIPLSCTVISLISFFPPEIKICVYILTSVNLYLIMQSLNVLLMFLPFLLPVKQKFPMGGTIVSICQTFGLTLKKYLL